MSLVRHLAGIPTATEQRCIRCCEVIRGRMKYVPVYAYWPGEEVLIRDGARVAAYVSDAPDCTPHDPHAIDDLREVLGEALAEMERAR